MLWRRAGSGGAPTNTVALLTPPLRPFFTSRRC